MKLYAILVVLLIAAAIAIEGNNAKLLERPAVEADADRMGNIFLEYRAALATFQLKNPTFTGSVATSQLNALGFQFPQDFIGMAGNEITSTGSSGRVVTSYGRLPPGSGPAAFKASGNDGSIGFASGSNWVSYGSGVTMPLMTPVQNGAVVSVIQIGK